MTEAPYVLVVGNGNHARYRRDNDRRRLGALRRKDRSRLAVELQ